MTFNTNCITGINMITGCNIRVNGIVLPEVPFTRFLGLWIDNKLQWNVDLSKLFLQLKRNTNMLRLEKHSLTIQAKMWVYYAHIYSHLTYGLILWGNMLNENELTKLQKIQNKCFKLICGEEASPLNYHRHHLL